MDELTAERVGRVYRSFSGPRHCWQTPEEFAWWLGKLAGLRPRRGLEIGTMTGASACTMAECLPTLERVVTIDTKDVRLEHPRVRFVRGNSRDPVTRRRASEALGGPADCLFVDGDHSLLGVTADFFGWLPLVRPGGLIGVHDVAQTLNGHDPATAGVSELWARLWREFGDRCEQIAIRQGIGVYRVPGSASGDR